MDDNNSHLHVHDAQSSVAFSFISLQSAHHQTFLDERVEEGGRRGIEATVSSNSLNIVINMSINHSRLGVVERTRILVGIIIWKEVDSGDGQLRVEAGAAIQ